MLLKQDISTYGEIEYTHTHTKATLKIQKTIQHFFPENIVTQKENVGKLNLLQMTLENRLNLRQCNFFLRKMKQ